MLSRLGFLALVLASACGQQNEVEAIQQPFSLTVRSPYDLAAVELTWGFNGDSFNPGIMFVIRRKSDSDCTDYFYPHATKLTGPLSISLSLGDDTITGPLPQNAVPNIRVFCSNAVSFSHKDQWGRSYIDITNISAQQTPGAFDFFSYGGYLVTIDAGPGNDYIAVAGWGSPIEIHGGDGADVIDTYGSTAGYAMSPYGDDGNDWIRMYSFPAWTAAYRTPEPSLSHVGEILSGGPANDCLIGQNGPLAPGQLNGGTGIDKCSHGPMPGCEGNLGWTCP